MENQTMKSTGCCEQFNPEPWQNKEITWNNKLFVKDRVTSFLHMPLNFGQKVMKNMKLIEAAGAKAEHQLMLTDENSLWGAVFFLYHLPEMRQGIWQKLCSSFCADKLKLRKINL